ncbi:TPA: hypothetical protein N0F65_003468 [Lagenidium giganteum]|uniref:5'-nucleotidase n=1 Tax=Lagenidium giganteum TaxID=4803 RepID=A0AAV2YPH8_9STRA|nr:TPA: hypothetical protein N0F65_003468 [Lagenidium giganteum]
MTVITFESTKAMATQEARKDAAAMGLDLDDELQQLLKEQETFMRENKKPAAKVKRMGKPVEAEAKKDEEDPAPVAPILKGVVERDVVVLSSKDLNLIPHKQEKGFPQVQRRGESLFGRRQRQTTQPPATPIARPAVARTPLGARKDDTELKDAEWNDIDEANTARINEMSLDKIRAAQEELKRSLDPQLLEKLMNRRAKPAPKKSAAAVAKSMAAPTLMKEGRSATKITPGAHLNTTDSDEVDRKAAVAVDLSKIQTEEELFEQAQHLPAEEKAKHEWMKPVQPKQQQQASRASRRVQEQRKNKQEASDERFNFDGDVVDANAALPVHSGLFHHGDEPEAAGYTMTELLHLGRSTMASQRTVALTTIAKILLKRQQQPTGSRIPSVLPDELPVTLRTGLDDQNYTALSAAVTALHAYMVPTIQRPQQDDFEGPYGSVGLPIKVHLHSNDGDGGVVQAHDDIVYFNSDGDEENAIDDNELLSLDPTQGMLQMDVQVRFAYIIDTIQLPEPDAVDKMFDILTQIARHSPSAAKQLTGNARLLHVIQKKYIESERVLTMEEQDPRALGLTLKALVLVRVICQGDREAAKTLMEKGLIQATKGFLAVKGDALGPMIEAYQLESLRIWRVLLGYGLDFHCFSYLFPLLCGFQAANLVLPKGEQPERSSTVRSATVMAALFGALEAFCGLVSVHEAQHYFSQLGHFIQVASSEACERWQLTEQRSSDVVLGATLRFLAAACPLAGKFHLDKTAFVKVFERIHDCAGITDLKDTTPLVHQVVVLRLHKQVIANGLLSDDRDDEEVAETFFHKTKDTSLAILGRVLPTLAPSDVMKTASATELALFVADMIVSTKSSDERLGRQVYQTGLTLLRLLGTGLEFWLHQLLERVIFHPALLQLIGYFPDTTDATRMSHVLIPMYQALVNSTATQEEHSKRLFDNKHQNPKEKQSCHLRLPQRDREYMASNLPLPSFWVFCPLSRLDFGLTGSDGRKLNPTPVQNEELRLIVSATCRFIYQLEVVGATATDAKDNLGSEDKLFHLMHFLVGILQHSSTKKKTLFDGMLRNLQAFTDLDPATANGGGGNVFTSDEQTVMTFVEKLVNEFTSSSYANVHFSRCITLFLMNEFPVNIRKWVWKELQDAHLLHCLQAFEPLSTANGQAFFKQSTTGVVIGEEQIVQLMTKALRTQLVTASKGELAYHFAVHHVVVYLFGKANDIAVTSMSFSRQTLLKELVQSAPRPVWQSIVSYDPVTANPMASPPESSVKTVRVKAVLEHGQLSSEEASKFCELCGGASSDAPAAPRPAMIVGDPDRFARKWKKFCTDGVDKLIVISDFDQTLTPYRKPDGQREQSSHGLLMTSSLIDPVIRKKEDELFEIYFPIEMSPTMTREEKLPFMVEWWNHTHKLLIDNVVTKKQIQDIVAQSDLTFRDGFTEIFGVLAQENVPTLIFSAGLYDVIHAVLDKEYAKTVGRAPPPNVHVVSNMMKFNEEGRVVDFHGNVIHCFNKNASVLLGTEFWKQCQMEKRHNILLLGDTIGDTAMANGLEFNEDEIIRVGFLNLHVEDSLEEFVNAYDVVLTNDASLRSVELLLHQLKK